MDADRVLTRHPEALEAEVDGDRVVMSPQNFAYFGLVGTGAAVWDLIDGSRTAAAVVEQLATRFAAPVDQVRSDVAAFVATLDAAGLLV